MKYVHMIKFTFDIRVDLGGDVWVRILIYNYKDNFLLIGIGFPFTMDEQTSGFLSPDCIIYNTSVTVNNSTTHYPVIGC
jgi:hypothetical protein